jgi:hypothetical protein
MEGQLNFHLVLLTSKVFVKYIDYVRIVKAKAGKRQGPHMRQNRAKGGEKGGRCGLYTDLLYDITNFICKVEGPEVREGQQQPNMDWRVPSHRAILGRRRWVGGKCDLYDITNSIGKVEGQRREAAAVGRAQCAGEPNVRVPSDFAILGRRGRVGGKWDFPSIKQCRGAVVLVVPRASRATRGGQYLM